MKPNAAGARFGTFEHWGSGTRYDAYYMAVAEEYQTPLLTYDKRMAAVAAERKIVCL